MVFVQDYQGSLRVSGNISNPFLYGFGTLLIEGDLNVGGNIQFGLGTNLTDPTNDKFFILGEENELAPGIVNILINGTNNIVTDSGNIIFGDFITINGPSNFVNGTNVTIGNVSPSQHNFIVGNEITMDDGEYNVISGNNISFIGDFNFVKGDNISVDDTNKSNFNNILANDVIFDTAASGSSDNFILGIGENPDIRIQQLINNTYLLGKNIHIDIPTDNSMVISPSPVIGGLYQGDVPESVHAQDVDSITISASGGIFLDTGSNQIETNLILYDSSIGISSITQNNDVVTKEYVDYAASILFPVFVAVGPLETFTTVYDAIQAGYSNIQVVGNTTEPIGLGIDFSIIQRDIYIVIQANVTVNYVISTIPAFYYTVNTGIFHKLFFEGPGTINVFLNNSAILATGMCAFIFHGDPAVGFNNGLGIHVELIGIDINLSIGNRRSAVSSESGFIIATKLSIVDTYINVVKQNIVPNGNQAFNIIWLYTNNSSIDTFIENITFNSNYNFGSVLINNDAYIRTGLLTPGGSNTNIHINNIKFIGTATEPNNFYIIKSIANNINTLAINNIYNSFNFNKILIYNLAITGVIQYNSRSTIIFTNVYNINNNTLVTWNSNLSLVVISISESLFTNIDTTNSGTNSLGRVKIQDTTITDSINLLMTPSNFISNININSCIVENGIFVKGGPASDNNRLMIYNNIVLSGEISVDLSINSLTVVTFDTVGGPFNYIVPSNVINIGYQVIAGGSGGGGGAGGGGMGYTAFGSGTNAGGGWGGSGGGAAGAPIVSGNVALTELAAGTNFTINVGAAGSNGSNGTGGNSNNGIGATGNNGTPSNNGTVGTNSTLVGPITNVISILPDTGKGGGAGLGGTQGSGIGGTGGSGGNQGFGPFPGLPGPNGLNGNYGDPQLDIIIPGEYFGGNNGTSYGIGGSGTEGGPGGAFAVGGAPVLDGFGPIGAPVSQPTDGAVILNVEQINNQFRYIIISDNFCNGINLKTNASLVYTQILNNNVLGTSISNISAFGTMERCIISNNIWNLGTLILGNSLQPSYKMDNNIIDSNIFNIVTVDKGSGTNNIYTNNISITSSSFPNGVPTVNAHNIL